VAWYTVVLLVISLCADGLVRRLTTGDLDLVVFFFKDALCLALWLICWPLVAGRPKRWLKVGLWVMMLALLPSLFLSVQHDPWLALYGLKQRLLPLGAALGVFVATSAAPWRVKRFSAVMVALLAVTGLLAVAQTFLPVDHWLNCGPEGVRLPPEHIKAGIPRVSSSFPFFAQYSYFLNFALPVTLSGLALMPSYRHRFLILVLAAIGIAGAFAANSRSAVFGPGLIMAASLVVLLIMRRWREAGCVSILLIMLATIPQVLKQAAPQVVAGYEFRAAKAEQRSGGNLQDIKARLLKEFDLANLASPEESEWFGSSLGSQSRGTELFSPRAAAVRKAHGWAETPLSATFLETSWWGLVTGGIMRMAFVGWLLLKLIQIQDLPGYSMSLFGFVTLVASIGVIDFQFPLACWFWLAVGLLLAHLHVPLREPPPKAAC